MHVVDASPTEKHKKKKKKHKDILQTEHCFTNDVDFGLVNDYVINKDSGDEAKIKKKKKKRKNLEHDGNEAVQVQNGLDTEGRKRKRSDLINDSKLLLNDDFRGSKKQKTHHLSAMQQSVNPNDLGSNDSGIIKKKKFKPHLQSDANDLSNLEDQSAVVKKKKKKRRKEMWGEQELDHHDKMSPQTDRYNKLKDVGSSTSLLSDISCDTEQCNVNDGVKKKKRHKDGSVANETEEQHEEIQYTIPKESCDNDEGGRKKHKKKRHKGDAVANEFLKGTSWENKTWTTQLCIANDETEKKQKKKKHLTVESKSEHPPKDEVFSTQFCSTINDQRHKKKRKHKKHRKDSATDGSESVPDRNSPSNDCWAGEIKKKEKSKKKRKEEATIDPVKTETIEEIESCISQTHFVLNETSPNVVSEKPAKVDRKLGRVDQLEVSQDTLPQVKSDGNLTACAADSTEEEKVVKAKGEERHLNSSRIENLKEENQREIETIMANKKRHYEIPSETFKGVDYVKHFLDKVAVRTKLTDDDKELLEQLHITIPFDIPLSHLIETRMSSHPTQQQRERFEELGLKMNVKHYGPVEDSIIKENWDNFCKLHNLPNDPTPFMNFEAFSDTKVKGSILAKEERIKFAQFLGQKLENRYLYSIYRRFKKLFTVVKRGRFTKREDEIIWDYVKQSDDTNQFSKLASVLNRDRNRILKHYRLLKAQRVNKEELDRTNCF